ncbi:MAG: hypothetical protein CMK36_06800 [Porticoccaceae bacterium]|nr:hypothetical protein [Porticoccaceae bacterium]
MSAFNELALNLIHIALQLCSFFMLVRLLLQWVQADFFNPLAQAIFRITAPLVEPLHRFFPTLGTFNTAALMGAFVFKWIYICILISTGQRLFIELPSYFLISIYEVIVSVVDIYFWGIIIIAVASWLDALQHPHVSLISQIVEPYISPFRRLIPPIGILDISSMVALIGLIIIRDRILPTFKYTIESILF